MRFHFIQKKFDKGVSMQILIVDGNLASSQIIIFDAGVMSLGHYWIITSFILIATDAIISHFRHKIKMNQAIFN